MPGRKNSSSSPSSSSFQSESALSSAESDLAACAAATAESASTSLPANRVPAFAATSPGTSAASPIITLHRSMCFRADAAFLRCCWLTAVSAVAVAVPAAAAVPLNPALSCSAAAAEEEVEETALPDIGARASNAS